MTEAKKNLEKQLWNIADTLRGKMSADDFRDYILGFIFYKYLSKKMELFANTILKSEKIKYVAIDENSAKGMKYLVEIDKASVKKLGYFLKPSELFSEVTKRGNSDGKHQFVLKEIETILKNIEKSTMGTESEEDFGNLFDDIDLASNKLGKTPNDKNELIVSVLTHLDKIDFEIGDAKSDVLGDAYEYLIGKFASGAGKTAGEFYTPQQVSKVLAKIVSAGKTKLKNVYDPTCGSGSLLLRVANEVTEVGAFYGQESNPTTYNLCRMNMIMHDVDYKRFDIYNDDTLKNPCPKHIDERFDAIVANPPFSANWSASPLFLNDDRFSSYGTLAPKTKADFAFVQHMIHQLDDNGTMACVLPHGALFRGSSELQIRKYLIKDCNYLDAVIGLPANLFYGTSIPACILVFKKKRKDTKDILFIDASKHFEKSGNQNVLREGKVNDIQKIVDTYTKRKAEDKYSYVATLKEVEENDYNLNIPRYVDTFEEEEPVILKEVSKALKDIDKEMQKTDKTIADFCKQLGIDTPF